MVAPHSNDPSVPLSANTLWLVERFFQPEDQEEARRMLVLQCARNLPSCEHANPASLERLRFAAIKISRGTLRGLSHAMREAQMDWRDLLMAADFGTDVDAHNRWLAQMQSPSNRKQ